ncbi:MAG: hypothetical protein AAF250_16540, partial [Pseudomonadota bacterium]
MTERAGINSVRNSAGCVKRDRNGVPKLRDAALSRPARRSPLVRRWRRTPLGVKLFGGMTVVAMLAVSLVAVAVAVNMRAGFSEYLLRVELAGLDAVVAALKTRPDAAEGWPGLRRDAAWDRFLRARSGGDGGSDAARPTSRRGPPP